MRSLALPSCLALLVVVAGCRQQQGMCPPGTTLNGRDSGDGWEQWCEKVDGERRVWSGPYRAWYRDGTLAISGQFEEWLRVGRWQMFYPNGGLHQDAELPNGIRKSYYFNGRLADVIQYDGDLRVGHWQEWFEDGTPKSDTTYPDGWSVEWHPNGVRHVEGAMKHGEKEGLWYLYTPEGNVAGQGPYEDGKENGMFVTFAREHEPQPLGTPTSARVFVDGSMWRQVPLEDVAKVGEDCRANPILCCEHVEPCRQMIPRMTHAQNAANALAAERAREAAAKAGASGAAHP